jgi:hypothetical protein
MRLIFVITLALFTIPLTHALEPKNGKEPTYCEQAVALHGFMSRAQFTCNYRYYAKSLTTDAAKCTKHELGDKYSQEVIKFGMSQFDERRAEVGKDKLCKEILIDFPEYVKK